MIETVQEIPAESEDRSLSATLASASAESLNRSRWRAEGVRSREMRQIEDILQSTSRNVLDVHQQRLAKSNKRSEALRATVRALVTTLEGKDLYTWGHSNRVAELSRLTAMRLGLDVDCCERIYTAGLLHDVGKLGIPDTVLNKAAQLSSAEYNLIRLHPVIGFEIVQRVSSLADVAPAVLYHHEAFDGAGYPDGLVGDEIPLDARILGVADAFDAMTSARSYRNKMSPRRAEAILLDGCGRQWDAECVRAFLSATDGARLTIQQPSMTSVRLR